MTKLFVPCIAFLLLGHTVLAFENGCKYKPNQLNDYGTGITKIVSNEKRSLPDYIPIQSEFEIERTNGKTKFYGTYEAFLRPADDDFLSILPIPILGFDVSRERIVVYICAHYTEQPEDSHLTIYFLRGYHIDPPTINNFLGDWVSGPSLTVKPVPASLLGISEVQKFFLKIFRYIPFVDLYFETWSLLQRVVANALGDVTGFGVERIELTPTSVRVASGVNLNSPRDTRFSRTFQIKRPDLGPGADQGTQNTRSLKNPDVDQALQDLNSIDVQYEEVLP
ncbi:MAG: hypothetical protein JNL11_09985 [Bdellovibrionaceae bacterium]|nr:hypothetical protein [Pseudobdellovibrionaceae bacterium]